MEKRGGDTEDFLRDLHKVYQLRGSAIIRKTAPEVYYRRDKGGRVSPAPKRGPVDFEGVLHGGRAVYFDAKETKSKSRLSLHETHVPRHQKDFLLDRSAFGAITFLFVCSTSGEHIRRYLYPITKEDIEIRTRKSIPFEEMIELPPSGEWLPFVEENDWIWQPKQRLAPTKKRTS